MACWNHFNISAMLEHRHAFWDSLPCPEERREKIRDHLQAARSEFINRKKLKMLSMEEMANSLCFIVNNTVVCEKAFAFTVGLVDKRGKLFKMWKEERQIFLGM